MSQEQELALSGPRREPASGGVVKELIVMLHGLGANGQDLISLVPFFAQSLPNAAFVAPDAPFACDMGPGLQWFSLQEREKSPMLAGMALVSPALECFIVDQLARDGLSFDRLVLMGFSQGGMMSLHMGRRLKEKAAGLMSYSGMLIEPDDTGSDDRARLCLHRPPVLLVHGAEDDIVPVAALPAAVTALETQGVEVRQQVIDGLGHAIDERGAQIGVDFCRDVLGYGAAKL